MSTAKQLTGGKVGGFGVPGSAGAAAGELWRAEKRDEGGGAPQFLPGFAPGPHRSRRPWDGVK